MVSELKDQNGLLKKEKDDLNFRIQEQSQQMTGTCPIINLNYILLYHYFQPVMVNKTCVLSQWSMRSFCVLCHPIRENGSGVSRGDSATGDGPERGALSLPKPADRTPSPGGEIRRPEGGDGSFLGEKYMHSDPLSPYERFTSFRCPNKPRIILPSNT